MQGSVLAPRSACQCSVCAKTFILFRELTGGDGLFQLLFYSQNTPYTIVLRLRTKEQVFAHTPLIKRLERT
ncbi:hypothetical protein XELAEV_18023274mg [Xenopus laevis]|uniref:Uncharacterized protein n=1 Tax=Xenopus laevis TaxID=8355 RepID=A0A974D409_XENLA|nr:hypothetical protein XELAEV_18023274mg [Xenopus laevis]